MHAKGKALNNEEIMCLIYGLIRVHYIINTKRPIWVGISPSDDFYEGLFSQIKNINQCVRITLVIVL